MLKNINKNSKSSLDVYKKKIKTNPKQNDQQNCLKTIQKYNYVSVMEHGKQYENQQQNTDIKDSRINKPQPTLLNSRSCPDNLKPSKPKKKSIFLEIHNKTNQQGKYCQHSRSNSRKISFQIQGYQEKTTKNLGQKQSMIDIVFTTSNISDQYWQTKKDFQFNLRQRSHKVLDHQQESKGKQIWVKKLQVNSKTNELYPNMNLDRMKSYQQTQNSRMQKSKLFDKSFSTNVSPDSPYSTIQDSLKPKQCKIETYEAGGTEQAFVIIQTPPEDNSGKQTLHDTITVKKKHSETTDHDGSQQLMESKESMIQSKNKQTAEFLFLKHPLLKQQNFPASCLSLESQTNLQNKKKSGRKSTIELLIFFEQDVFQKVNLYRFYNRMIYKVRKYLYFDSNGQQLRKLSNSMINQKCCCLLNAQKQIQNCPLDNLNVTSDKRRIYLEIVNCYIFKQNHQIYWNQVLRQFKNNNVQTSELNSLILSFLKATFPEMQREVNQVKEEIQKQVKSKRTLLIQLKLKLKLMKYLFYDIYMRKRPQKVSQTYQKRILQLNQRRIMQIIQNDQWSEKISSNAVLSTFQKLKKDFAKQL